MSQDRLDVATRRLPLVAPREPGIGPDEDEAGRRATSERVAVNS